MASTARDTGRRRDADAARSRAVATERFGPFPRLYFYTLALPLPDGVPLHSETASRAARAVVSSVFGAAPTRWKLERGRGGGLHLHAVSPLPPVAVHEFADVRPVWNVRRLLAYLAKPADARLTRPRLTPWTDARSISLDYRAALEDRARALEERRGRGYRRLPPVSGWTGTRPGGLPVLARACLTLAYARAALAYPLAYLLARLPAPEGLPCLPCLPALPAVPCPGPHLARRWEPHGPERPTRGLAL